MAWFHVITLDPHTVHKYGKSHSRLEACCAGSIEDQATDSPTRNLSPNRF